jgi:hydrogenase-4 component F
MPGGNTKTGILFSFSAIIFIMASTVLPAILGKVPSDIEPTGYNDTHWTVLPLLVLMGIILMLGLWIPLPFQQLLRDGAELLGGGK